MPTIEWTNYRALATDLIAEGRRHRCGWRKQYRSGRQIAHLDDPNRLHQRPRPGQGRARHEPQPAGSERDRGELVLRRAWAKARRAIARARASGRHDRLVWSISNNIPRALSTSDRRRTGPAPLGGGCSSSRQVPRTRLTARSRHSCNSGRTLCSSERARFIPRALASLPSWRHGMVVPLISGVRELPAAGGLISYGNSVTDAYRRVGTLHRPHPQGARTGRPTDRPRDQI